jgi:chemotaxis signal transduction protein
MAIYSPLRSRRLAARQTEATQRLITFRLEGEIFAIPLDRVHKAITLDAAGERLGHRLYGDPQGTGVSLIAYQGRELVVIDVGHQIFGKTQQILPVDRAKRPTAVASTSKAEVGYLLILQPEPDRLIGLPIDSPPSIQSLQISAFQPLPAIYQQYRNIHCVSAMSIELADRPAMFLLDVTALGQPSASASIDSHKN